MVLVKVVKNKITLSCIILLFTSLLLSASASQMAAQPLSTDSWEYKASMNYPISGVELGVANGKIYALGGATNHGFCNTTEEYNPATDYWTVKASMPITRGSFGVAVWQNKIYCIGGDTGGGDFGSHPSTINAVYDPAIDIWETKTSMPNPIEGAEVNVVNDKIYVIGGSPGYTLNQVYDPANDSWTTKAPLPKGIYGSASAVIDAKIYIFYDGLTTIYDTQTDKWSHGTPPPLSLVFEAACATTGVYAPERIYVFGVDSPMPSWPLQTKGLITQSYNPKTDSWEVCAAMPNGRYGVGVAAVDDLLYVIGGVTTAFRTDKFTLNPIYTYIPFNQQYTPLGYGTIPAAISITSPLNDANYTSGNVSLAFATNKPVTWQGYRVDDQEIATLTGNTTISGLSNGQHNITVYAQDSFGNNASQTITFNVNLPKAPQTILAAVGSGATAVVICIGAIVYFKKRKSRV
jgi:N-acetylneuraminic acid mutarotase